MRARSLLCLGVMSFGVSTVMADAAAIARCRTIIAAQERLACYDEIRLPLPGAAVPQRAAPASVAEPNATFGFESRQVPLAVDTVDTVASSVDGHFDGWVPRRQVRLANGQVWEISDGSTAAYDLRDPGVRISRGVSGTFFMAIQGVAQTPRVRRVK